MILVKILQLRKIIQLDFYTTAHDALFATCALFLVPMFIISLKQVSQYFRFDTYKIESKDENRIKRLDEILAEKNQKI